MRAISVTSEPIHSGNQFWLRLPKWPKIAPRTRSLGGASFDLSLDSASSEDEPWLENLRRNVYQELFFLTWGGWDEARHKRHFADFIAHGHIFIVEVDQTRVGMIQIFEEPDALEVGEIQILPSDQNRGVGTALLKDAISRAHGHKECSATPWTEERETYRLYERLGFRLTNRTETHYHMVCEPPSKHP